MRALPRLLPFLVLLAAAGPVYAETAPPSGAALSEDDCRAIWNTGAGRSGFFGPDGAKPYIDDFGTVDSNHDNKISNAEFKAGCEAGLVHKFRSQK